MRLLPVIVTTAGLATAAPALAADLSVSVDIPRLNTASYHRPYVAVWIERPDQTAVRTLASGTSRPATAKATARTG